MKRAAMARSLACGCEASTTGALGGGGGGGGGLTPVPEESGDGGGLTGVMRSLPSGDGDKVTSLG